MKKIKAKIDIKNIGDPGPFGWQDALITFDGNQYKIEGHDDPQAVVASAFIRNKEVLCVRKRDFGGCGKDAIKPEIIPFELYLAECGELTVE